MRPTMLVSGGDTPLGTSIVAKALGGFNVAATTVVPPAGTAGKNGRGPISRPVPGSPLLLPWSPQSPVSARNVVLRTVESYDAIDQVIVIHSLPTEVKRLHELPLAAIEEITDTRLKSHLFLLREVIAHFLRRRAGLLALVVDRSETEALATMDSVVTEGFVALAKSLMAAYRDEPFTVCGFESTSRNRDSCASFILSTLGAGERSGRWFAFGERSGLLRSGIRAKTKH